MTTENGLASAQSARKSIETLRRRLEYLNDKIAELIDDGGRQSELGFTVKEAKSLEWALPVLEAEYDALVRLRRSLGVEHGALDVLNNTPEPRCFVDHEPAEFGILAHAGGRIEFHVCAGHADAYPYDRVVELDGSPIKETAS